MARQARVADSSLHRARALPRDRTRALPHALPRALPHALPLLHTNGSQQLDQGTAEMYERTKRVVESVRRRRASALVARQYGGSGGRGRGLKALPWSGAAIKLPTSRSAIAMAAGRR